jgi:WD40 repeat protein
LASAGYDHTVKLWDTRSGKLLHTLEGHGDTVYVVAFDPTGGTLATGGGNTVKLWDPIRGTLLRTGVGPIYKTKPNRRQGRLNKTNPTEFPVRFAKRSQRLDAFVGRH